jgi:fumarylpyruvate hydrolase
MVQAFPNSAVVGPWVDIKSFPAFRETEFAFSLDGQERQRGSLKQMMYTIGDAIQMVRDSFTLVPGDLIFTGTPHGVGPLKPGQIGQLRWGDKVSYDIHFR